MNPSIANALNHYRLLGRSGVRVSPLCLGTMTFGNDWGWGAEKDESHAMFDLYLERGGNFIDTANLYTNGASETMLGEFMQGRREQLVLATKFTLNMRKGDPNAGGNHRKNIVQSIEASLRRLRTDYIDLYWLHAWESRTPIEEVLRSLDDLVRAGKVLYIGLSNTPAWKVAQANTLADLRGWTPFIAMQLEYSLIERNIERELVPLALEGNLGITPWSPLGGGILTGKYNPLGWEGEGTAIPSSRGAFVDERINPKSLAISTEVQRVAREVGRTPTQVALRWLLERPAVASPIIGARTVKQLEDNLGCLEFALESEHMARLEEVSKIELGYPYEFLQQERIRALMDGGAVIE